LTPTSERLTPVLVLAGNEAHALRHSYVGTEHLLLALLRDQDSVAARTLASLGIPYADVRTAVVRMLGTGVDEEPDELPLTSQAERAVELAEREAADRGQAPADTQHLLLALASGAAGAAGRILLQLDADGQTIAAAIDALPPAS
jgi:ATP-dependent Clp protease ATP-binding subunit ClpC